MGSSTPGGNADPVSARIAIASLGLLLLLAGIPAASGPEAREPALNAYGSFVLSRGDTHIHTLYSDGATNLTRVVEVATQRNLSWAVITDHALAPPAGVCESHDTPTFLCVPGSEITEAGGHATTPGVTRTIPAGTPIGEAMHQAFEQGGLVFVAHPFAEPSVGEPYARFGVDENYTGLEIYHGYAGWNDEMLSTDMDLLAVQKWDELLQSRRRVVGVGASDSHDANNSWDQGDLFNARGAVGYPKNVAYLREFSRRGVLEALERGRLTVTDGPALELTVGPAVSGDELRVSGIASLAVNLTGSTEGSSTVRLLDNGTEVWFQAGVVGPYAFTIPFTPAQDTYLRAEVRSYNGSLFSGETHLAFANPVYLDTLPYDEPPGPPTGLRAWIQGDDVALAWDASAASDLSHYAIYRADSMTAFDFTYRHARAYRTTWRDVGAARDGQTHYYIVRAVDRMGHEENNTALAVKMAFPVVPGLNLLGVPIPLLDVSLSSVLQTVNHTDVRAFDPTLPSPWSSYHAGRGGGLAALPTGSGFWVTAPTAGTYAVAGIVPVNATVSLRAGWNLVAYASQTPRTVATALVGVPWIRVEVFDLSAGAYRLRQATAGVTLSPGQGLWVMVTADAAWMIPR